MRVRKLDSNGDYTFGFGDSTYFKDSPAGVGQTVKNRLSLWTGEWFLDKESGTPWLGDILGESVTAEAVLRDRILDTTGVNEILLFESSFNPNSRKLTVTATIETIYGETALEAVV